MDTKTREAVSLKMKGNKNRVGKTHSYRTKDAIKQSMKALSWYNDGAVEIRCKAQPIGFVKGRLSNKGTIWVNDGKKEVQIFETNKLDNQVKGRLFSLKGYHWYSGFSTNVMKKEVPERLLECRKLHHGMVPANFKRLPAYLEKHPNYQPKPDPVVEAMKEKAAKKMERASRRATKIEMPSEIEVGEQKIKANTSIANASVKAEEKPVIAKTEEKPVKKTVITLRERSLLEEAEANKPSPEEEMMEMIKRHYGQFGD